MLRPGPLPRLASYWIASDRDHSDRGAQFTFVNGDVSDGAWLHRRRLSDRVRPRDKKVVRRRMLAGGKGIEHDDRPLEPGGDV